MQENTGESKTSNVDGRAEVGAGAVVEAATAFGGFNLEAPLAKALKAMNFNKPTPIQEDAIPIALLGKDLIGCAQTGTGKTAAFAVPLMNRLMKVSDEKALVLVPTRELAEQVTKVMNDMARFTPSLRPALIIGGLALSQQATFLARNPRIIVATPGRLTDHISRKTANLSAVSVLVLDEADRMLDMGFAPQIAQILRHVPQKRQTLLFSATLPDDILKLTKQIMKNPVRVSVDSDEIAAPLVDQSTVQLTIPEKDEALLDQINARKGSILVFVRTKSRVERVLEYLESYGVPVVRMHGGRSQAQRRRALDDFREGKARVLIATDVAARGIDIPHVGHVINFDLPVDPEDYVHRIGRTGRNGREGEAVSFLTPDDRNAWRAIQSVLGLPAAGGRGGGRNGFDRHAGPKPAAGKGGAKKTGGKGGHGGGSKNSPKGGSSKGGGKLGGKKATAKSNPRADKGKPKGQKSASGKSKGASGASFGKKKFSPKSGRR